MRNTGLFFLSVVIVLLTACSSSGPHQLRSMPTQPAVGLAAFRLTCDTSNPKQDRVSIELLKKNDAYSRFVPVSMLNASCQQQSRIITYPFAVGTYRLHTWTMNKSTYVQPIATPFYFTIHRHTVTYLGHIKVRSNAPEGTPTLTIEQGATSADKSILTKAYPQVRIRTAT